jgi:2-methylisocitrate lyase-like PEP mutase family enzyme
MLGGAARTWPGHAPSPLEMDLPAHEMAQFNVRIVIYGAAMLSRSYAFMEKEYSSWLASGRFEATAQDDIDRVNALKLVGLLEKEALLRKYGE